MGLATSLKTGIAAVPADADGAIVCLGDMPQVDAALIDQLIAAFDPEKRRADRGADRSTASAAIRWCGRAASSPT